MAIANDEDCDEPNEQLGETGNCGSYYAGTIYIVMYLVFSFLIIVNMYIAVILETGTKEKLKCDICEQEIVEKHKKKTI